MSRSPSPPPEIPGFTYLNPLGTGGFADVFLYEQQLPRRRVAVKVLLADRLASGATEEFITEANVMAMLSTHPTIVTIYQAGVASDGRPYLVMEYCPRPNLQVRVRQEVMSVPEALRVGIQVAGAVETAHRAGVLHRDIKPANILVTEYNRPALTDFGIASTAGQTNEPQGLSIPWSPPEVFRDPGNTGPASDVYSLGATLFTLLAGRSPFQSDGKGKTAAELIQRIENDALPPINRADIPRALVEVLDKSMAKDPQARYETAVAFGRALQKVQIALAHAVTPIDIVDDHADSDHVEDEDDGLTRVRGIVDIDAGQQDTRSNLNAAQAPREPDAHLSTRPVRPGEPIPFVPTGVVPSNTVTSAAPGVIAPVLAPNAASASAPKKDNRVIIIVGIAVAVAIIIVIVVANLLGPAPTPETETPPVSSTPQEISGSAVPMVTDLRGERTGNEVTFTWTNPEPKEGDYYLWAVASLDEEVAPRPVREQTITVPIPEGESRVCVDISLVRQEGRASDAERGCVG